MNTQRNHGDGPKVCGQAHVVLDSLSRVPSLPGPLSHRIEEILERAWEIAYRRRVQDRQSNVIAFPCRLPGQGNLSSE